MAIDEYGTLYAAWTTQQNGVYMYWSIHAIRSRDGGVSWERLDGTPLTTPVVCDDTGPAQEITLPSEHPVHTWLWNPAARNGRMHFAYLAQFDPGRSNYVRYDTHRGAEDLRIAPTFRGDEVDLRNLDGFSVYDPGSPRRIFWVSQTAMPTPRIGILQSFDSGSSWFDFGAATSDGLIQYAISGYRQVSDSGHILGAFTDTRDLDRVHVYFFRARVRTFDEPALCL